MSGGAESMLTRIIQALPSHNHIVVSFINGGIFESRLRELGVAVIGLEQGRGRPIHALFVLPRLRAVIRELRPDILQGWMYHGNLAASIVARDIPVLWNIRQRLEGWRSINPVTRAVVLSSLLYRKTVSAVIYNSLLAATDHEGLGYPRSRRIIIPNGFDLSLYKPDVQARCAIRAELGVSDSALLIGRVARDAPIKDTPTLVAAVARMQHSDARLVLVGRGMSADNQGLVDLLRAAGVAHRTHLLGERSDIQRINAALDVAVSSSSHGEGFPNVICEAMACETPIVATDVAESRQIVGDDSRIVPPRDSSALAAALDSVLRLSPAERGQLGARDRERVATYYSLSDVARKYAELWERAAASSLVVGGAAPAADVECP